MKNAKPSNQKPNTTQPKMNIIKQIEEKIITIDNHLVMIDSDVAALYVVETKRVNEAVKNNPENPLVW